MTLLCVGEIPCVAMIVLADETIELPEAAVEQLKRTTANPAVKWQYNSSEMRRQPAGVPKDGYSFTWAPSDGEVIVAGPTAKMALRPYVSEYGLMVDAPPMALAQKL